ncbi:fructose-6-phosphate aldolase [Paenibacillus sp. N4]|uniref:fructose-6-phosphate aldolase n=1 Tax=Paenibacillus vietnamensis TaxID=2590547 RepID=UPI001CD0E133|nr:fructose-6-phosphate aldolase [Paenibacillus vietnamensis]MCA0757596.1 fructose-6-phosphate aldolase [Paenibacillus vietnamensis]
MELYVDTADLTQIREAVALGILDGVTTNPSIIAKQKRPFRETIGGIAELVPAPGKVWCEVIGTDADTMVAEAKEMQAWAPRVVVKLPMGAEGVKAASRLSKEGIETNMTLVYSVPQAIIAAKAGVAYVSPYLGRVDDAGWSGEALIGDIVQAYKDLGLSTKVIAASIRGPRQVLDMFRVGVDAVTMAYPVLEAMLNHPMTEIGLNRFLQDWQDAGI